jgi:hypothetical protein
MLQSHYKSPKSLILMLLLGSVFTFQVHALSLSISTNQNQQDYSINDEIGINLKIKNNSDWINAFDALVYIPNEYFEVVSVSFEDSVIDYWVENTDLVKSSDTLYLAGVTFNGFRDTEVQLAKVKLKVKKVGNVSVDIIDGRILKNDGLATELDSNKENLTLSILNQNSTYKPTTLVTK